MAAEGHLAGGKDRAFRFWNDFPNRRPGGSETLLCSVFIRAADQAGFDIAAVGAIKFVDGFFEFVDFVQLPLGGGLIQLRHSGADQNGGSCGDEELQAFNMNLAHLRLAADIKPEDGEG